MKNVSIVTLGCSKNDIDTQLMKSILDRDHFNPTENLEESEVIIVNTCGFIESAKEESIDTILSMAQFKEHGKLEKILLAGCLAERYPEELLEELPEVDGILGTGNIRQINEALLDIYKGQRVQFTGEIEAEYIEDKPREDVGVTEYVQIAEGCNNQCTYCIIPALKGKNKSRAIEAIVREVEDLVARGTREIIIIAQNITDYGIDLYGKRRLADLLREFRSIEDLKWVRLLYAYPEYFTQELVDEMNTNPKIVPYIDIPLQHVSDNILRAMGRKSRKEDIIHLINTLRRDVDDISIRSTFIVGFPGETEEDFEELLTFLEDHPLDRVGSFTYSPEEGTPAFLMDGQVDEETKISRQERLMLQQELISAKLLERRVGQTVDVLIEEKVEPGLYVGRSPYDAPEIDGVVYVESPVDLTLGNFYPVKIQKALEHDFRGELDEYSK